MICIKITHKLGSNCTDLTAIIVINIIMAKQTKNDVRNYLDQLANNIGAQNSFSQHGKALAQSVNRKVEQQILESQISLPARRNRRSLSNIEGTVQIGAISQANLLKKVENQKQALLSKIRALQQQQNQLKNRVKSNESPNLNAYSEKLTQEDRKKLKELVRAHKDFQRSLEKKNQQLKEIYKSQQLQSDRKLQQQYQINKAERKKRIMKYLQELQQKANERRQFLKQASQVTQQIKQTKYLHELKQLSDKYARQQSYKQYEKKLEEIRSSHRVSIQQIKQHERRYEQHLENSRFKASRSSSQHLLHRSKSYGDNYYRSFVKAELQQHKMRELQKLSHGRDIKKRIDQFKQKVQAQYKPIVTEKSKFKPSKSARSVNSLNNAQQRQKGLEYLEKAKKLKSLKILEKKVQNQKQQGTNREKTRAKRDYKDYTKQLKLKPYQTAQSQFMSMLQEKKALNDYESAIKVYNLSSKISARLKTSNDQKLLIDVINKMRILKALE